MVAASPDTSRTSARHPEVVSGPPPKGIGNDLVDLRVTFMPHGYCYLWNAKLIWLHAGSDALIFLSYLSIPFTLLYFVRRRRDLPFHWMFLCFGTFIIACGFTHGMEI